MSWLSRSRALAAVLAAAVTVPLVTDAVLTAPVAASAPRTSLLIWGVDRDNNLGPLAGTGNATLPVPFPIPAGMVRSGQFGCFDGYVLTRAGRILAWGDNGSGQLGAGLDNPDPTATPEPVLLPAGARAVSVRAGCNHAVALLSTGRVVAWGLNQDGEVSGSDSAQFSPVPVALPGNLRFAAVCAGFDFSLALSTGGRVYAWGDNTDGQSGDGTHVLQNPVPVPVKIPSRTHVTAIACGWRHALALTSAGRVLAWGLGEQGALGAAHPGKSRVPVPVQLPAKVRIRALFAGERTSMALSTTGQVWTWGDNGSGQLGNGSTADHSRRPMLARLPAGTKVRKIAASRQTDLVLTTRGTILTWGANFQGQLGTGRVSVRSRVPVAVHLPAGQAALSVFAGSNADDILAVTRSRRWPGA